MACTYQGLKVPPIIPSVCRSRIVVPDLDEKEDKQMPYTEVPNFRFRPSPALVSKWKELNSSWLEPAEMEWIFNENKKEDKQMSSYSEEGQAYFCRSCRKAFPKDEVFFFRVSARIEGKPGHGNLATYDIADCALCRNCFEAFKAAVEKFHLPWDEWRKKDKEATP